MFTPCIHPTCLLSFARGVDEQANFFAENRGINLCGYVFYVSVQSPDFFGEGRGEHAKEIYMRKVAVTHKNIPLKKATTSKGLCEKDVEDSSYHRHGIAYLEGRLKEEVGHESMYALETCKCL